MTEFLIGLILGLILGTIVALFILSIFRVAADDDRRSQAEIDDEFTTNYLKGLSRGDNRVARPPFPPDTKKGHRPYAPSPPPRRPDGEPPVR